MTYDTKAGYILKIIKRGAFLLVLKKIIKYSAIDEDAAFLKNMQLFANPYCYFDLNKSIAWRYDGRGGLPGGEKC